MSLPEEISLQVEASLSFGKRVELAVSRVLSWATIPLDQQSLTDSSNLPDPHAGHTLRDPIWSCSGWSLPCHTLLPEVRCALTAPFHPYRHVNMLRRSSLCCTCRRLTPPRRYLAPCPMEPGLSSILHRWPTRTMTTETGPRSPSRLPPCQHRPTGKRRQVGYSSLIAFELLQHQAIEIVLSTASDAGCNHTGNTRR